MLSIKNIRGRMYNEEGRENVPATNLQARVTALTGASGWSVTVSSGNNPSFVNFRIPVGLFITHEEDVPLEATGFIYGDEKIAMKDGNNRLLCDSRNGVVYRAPVVEHGELAGVHATRIGQNQLSVRADSEHCLGFYLEMLAEVV